MEVRHSSWHFSSSLDQLCLCLLQECGLEPLYPSPMCLLVKSQENHRVRTNPRAEQVFSLSLSLMAVLSGFLGHWFSSKCHPPPTPSGAVWGVGSALGLGGSFGGAASGNSSDFSSTLQEMAELSPCHLRLPLWCPLCWKSALSMSQVQGVHRTHPKHPFPFAGKCCYPPAPQTHPGPPHSQRCL